MNKFEKFLGAAGIASLLLTGACSATTGGGDGDAMADGMIMPDTGGTDAGGTKDTTSMAMSFKSIAIWDKSEEQLDCTKAASPGTDLDAVMLYRGGTLIAAGKPGTAKYAAGTTPLCTVNDKIKAKQVDKPEGKADGHVYKTDADKGYFSLNGGSMEIQFGKCTQSGPKADSCDGAGDLVDVLPGDEIDVYEVDDTYKAAGKGITAGWADEVCVCYADEYQVDLRPTAGADAGAVTLPGVGKGNSKDGKWYAGTTTVKIPMNL